VLDKLKAFVAAIVTAVGGIVALLQVTLSDKAISLDEANGLWLAVTAALTTIAAAYGVWRAPNKPA